MHARQANFGWQMAISGTLHMSDMRCACDLIAECTASVPRPLLHHQQRHRAADALCLAQAGPLLFRLQLLEKVE